jgi:hypothetical protein
MLKPSGGMSLVASCVLNMKFLEKKWERGGEGNLKMVSTLYQKKKRIDLVLYL